MFGFKRFVLERLLSLVEKTVVALGLHALKEKEK